MDSVSSFPIAPLRPDLNIIFQEGTQPAKVMLSHPITGKNFLLPQRSFRILQSIQPGQTIDDVITAATGTATPPQQTRDALTALLRQTSSAGLLETSEPAPPAKSLKRWNPFFIRIPLVNPEPVLDHLRGTARVLFSIPAFVLWLVSFALVSSQLALHGREHLTYFSVFGRFAAWPLFYLLWGVSAAWHEMGHALACLRWRVRVREIGILFYMFYPGAYADVSAAWTLPQKRQRIVVSLGGLYMDSIVWIGAVAYWLWQGVESIAGQTAFIFSVVLIFRILVNFIPFLRMDGYWVLSDLLQMPNLRPRAYAYLWSLVCPPAWNRLAASRQIRKNATLREALVFFVYGLAALCFSALMGFYGLLALVHLLQSLYLNAEAHRELWSVALCSVAVIFAGWSWRRSQLKLQSAQKLSPVCNKSACGQ